ncbi:MAG: cellulase family glycosylhydrolase [Candidatus Omnitrophica bacterium]|nr:cellulase family glycosylhydrolase [Candidatus Omnitrophota bacterium]
MKLKGVNLGSWLMMEGYILGGRNIPESIFKQNFGKINGKAALSEFIRLFRDNFISEDDFKNISQMGANCIRLPFNYRLITKEYPKNGLTYLKKALTWAHKYNLGVILDLHAAPGAQNCDWHSDSTGRALFWEKEKFRKETLNLWDELVSEFKDEPALIGFDIINEPVLGEKPVSLLAAFYKEAVKRIKTIDKKHTIFLEGSLWAQRIDFLKDLIEENVSISIHTYQPLDFTFNFEPFYKFPGKINNELWEKEKIRKYLEPYFLFSKNNKVPIFVGEFGVNWRGGFWGEINWLQDILETFEEFGFGYTYWTYKAVSGYVFPDGLYQYIQNSKYIMREGPIYGWENYITSFQKEKNKIADFWQTKNFIANDAIISKLKEFFKK